MSRRSRSHGGRAWSPPNRLGALGGSCSGRVSKSPFVNSRRARPGPDQPCGDLGDHRGSRGRHRLGFARMARHDPWSGRPSLDVVKIVSCVGASARGSRGAPGAGSRSPAVHERRFRYAARARSPEVLRADLAEDHARPPCDRDRRTSSIRWLDAPPRAALAGAEQLLSRLGALDPSGGLSPVGREMVRFPLAAAAREASRRGPRRAEPLARARSWRRCWPRARRVWSLVGHFGATGGRLRRNERSAGSSRGHRGSHGGGSNRSPDRRPAGARPAAHQIVGRRGPRPAAHLIIGRREPRPAAH